LATQTVTVLFTDLVGSTELSSRLGPEATEALRQTHFGLLRGAIQTAGGTEVKNLGDGLMVAFTSLSRALACAMAMQQAIERHNHRDEAAPLSVRIGISTGEATEEDGDYFGDPVVEAARLCGVADGGQILATEVVRLMAGRHATQTFVAVGPLELKGIPEPVDAVEVLWEPATEPGSVPLPGRLVGAATDGLFGFFGRGPELAVLEEAAKQAHSTRRCQAVFVAGEAGMGKTALVAQVARAAHGDGAVVLFGHADEDLGVAYQPWIEALSCLVRFGDADLVDGLRSAQRTALARLVPELASDGQRVADPDTERMLLLEGATELLVAASQGAPVLIVLDDLHWADTASLQLLRHVVGSTTPMDVTIACTYRDTDLTRGDPLTKLLADMHREANVTRISLAGLEDNELVDLLAAAAGHTLDDDGVGLAHALRRETDGNPFFTAELLRHLSESGGIVVGDDGRWALAGEFEELGLPSSVRDVVGRRVERLGDEALRVLCLAAVIGREFDLDLLAVLADVDEDSLLDVLDLAVNAAVLVESGTADRFRFAHALIQHTLYDDISPSRRHRAHQRVAETLETRTTTEDAATLAELAHHWVAATRPADLDKALGYVRRAGDAARDALAPDDAIRWYQQALDLCAQASVPNERIHVELLVALGKAQYLAGRTEYRNTLLDAFKIAEDFGDGQLVIQVGLGFAFFTGNQSGDSEAHRVVAAALERVGPAELSTRARLLAAASETCDATTQAREGREFALQACEAARSAGGEATFVEVINGVHPALESPDLREAMTADLEDAVTMADRIGDPVLRVTVRYRALWSSYQRVDLESADRRMREIQALAEEVGLPQVQYECALATTGRLLFAGDADAAEVSIDAVLKFGTAAGNPDALSAYGGILYGIGEHRGRIDEIAEFLMQAAIDNPSIPALRSVVPAMLCELGRLDEARERLAAEAASGFDYPFNSLWLASMTNVTDAAASTRDRQAALALIELLRPFADHVNSPAGVVVNGAVARSMARAATLLGDYDQAEEWFAIAHDIHQRLQAPYWTARGQLDHADLCLVRRADGDLERAGELITTAAAIAAEYGCGGLTERAAALLVDL
jgi:class 3 adenylate cyclase/tetratricopeptide (TPR) repeat protein